jgi:UDP-N-acetyl-D-glucosamine dehydrogenase
MLDSFVKKVKSREAVVCVIGLGYVGLPLVLRFSEAGFRVIGIDIDQQKISALNAGRTYIRHISSDAIGNLNKGGFEATTDMARVREADALIICVPTPLSRYREPDLSFILNTVDSFLPHLRRGQCISLESTTYPGTTEEEIKPRLERRDFTVGKNIFLCFSPEREDPGKFAGA